jgi:hypothetical protein
MLNLLPKDQGFYDQPESLSDQVVAGAAELRRLMQEFPAEARERAKALEAKDKAMEKLVQSALERLDVAFIRPLPASRWPPLRTPPFPRLTRSPGVSQASAPHAARGAFVGSGANVLLGPGS